MVESHLTSDVFRADEMVDRTLRNHKLERLHHSLTAVLGGYVGMYEAGSTTAGDPWVPGRSDRDITIVFTGRTRGQLEQELGRRLPALEFNDTYLFTAVPKGRFLTTHVSQDLSMKFRGCVLFGEDLIQAKETPSRAFAHKLAQAGLRSLRGALGSCVLNAGAWSLPLMQDKLYDTFKLFLMYLAADAYANTGRYPKRRADVADAHESDKLLQISDLVARIDDAEKAELLDATLTAREMLKDFLVSERAVRAVTNLPPLHDRELQRRSTSAPLPLRRSVGGQTEARA